MGSEKKTEEINVQVYLCTQEKAPLLSVSKNVTIKDILEFFKVNIDGIVVFTGNPNNKDYHTPMVDLNKTLVDYNMWHIEKNYIAEFSVFKVTDKHLYNEERLEYYEEAFKHTIK
jgi:hypothetical protein